MISWLLLFLNVLSCVLMSVSFYGSSDATLYKSTIHSAPEGKQFSQPNMIWSCRNHHHHLHYKPISSETVLVVVNHHYAYYQSVPFYDNESFPAFCRLYNCSSVSGKTSRIG